MRRLALATAIVGLGLLVGLGSAAAMSAHVTGGTKLAFVRGGAKGNPSVWVSNVTGSGAKKLGAGDSALVSPNGSCVAASRYASTGDALTIFGKTSHRFISLKIGTATPLAWSSNSQFLAVQVSGDSTNPLKGSGLDVINTANMTVVASTVGEIYGASFEPSTSTSSFKLLFGVSQSISLTAKANIDVLNYTSSAHFAGRSGTVSSSLAIKPLIADGHSLNPLWTAKGIVYDHEKLRSKDGYAAYQLWLRTSPGHKRQLTHVKVGPLVSGLVPVQASSRGGRLIAAYVGEDTDYAWRVQISPLRVSPIKVKKELVQSGGISSDGTRLLVDQGAFMDYPDKGHVESLPFFGGKVHALTRGDSPSWNF